MRWVVRGGGMAILALASCASPTPKAVVADTKSPDQGIILAIRPVQVGDPRAAGLLRVGPDAAPNPAGNAEYVVRTGDGATVAIMQRADPALRPGTQVAIGRGERATLVAR